MIGSSNIIKPVSTSASLSVFGAGPIKEFLTVVYVYTIDLNSLIPVKAL